LLAYEHWASRNLSLTFLEIDFEKRPLKQVFPLTRLQNGIVETFFSI
jgi:hypothetical protein